jgi:plastocyanin
LALPLLFAATLVASRLTGAEVTLRVTDAKNTPLADAVVSLQPIDAPSPVTPPGAPQEIVQQGKEFLPFVTAVVVGTTVTLPNRDKVEHQVYSLSEAKKFELPLYKPGKAGTVVFDRAGVVTLGCNIHDWMLAYVVVLDTPWFAKSDASGAASVSAPAGRYRLAIWHPRLAQPLTREITLPVDAASPPLPIALTLKPERRIRRAPEAAGGGYK